MHINPKNCPTAIPSFLMSLVFFIGISALPAHSIEESSVTYTYDNANRLETTNGPRSDIQDITSFTYYTNSSSPYFGRLHTVTNALGHVLRFDAYNEYGKPEKIVDGNGVETQLSYNPRGLLLKIIVLDPDRVRKHDLITEYSYNDKDQVQTIVLPNGSALTHEYDDAGRLTAVENLEGERLEYSYDVAGNRTQDWIKNSSGNIERNLQYSYDELSRLKGVADHSGDFYNLSYDANNRTTEVINGRGHSEHREYDSHGRLSKQIDSIDNETLFGYNDQNLVTSVTDANGNITTYGYNVMGNLTSLTSPDTGTTTYTYDAAGNRISSIDSRNVITEYRYDALNRLIEIIYPASPLENVTYHYDDMSNGNMGEGKLTSISSSTNLIQFKYDFAGMMVQKTSTIGTEISVTSYTYDSAGQLVSLVYPSGRHVRYGRDSQGRITSVYSRANEDASEELLLSALTHLPFGPVSGYTYGNGLSHMMSYDERYRLTGIEVGGINPVFDRKYEYDPASNVQYITDDIDSLKSQSFDYDELERLIRADGNYGSIDYSYDPVGNRLSREMQRDVGLVEETYTYDNGNNQLLYVDSSTNGIPSHIREFVYDDNGNRISGQGVNGDHHSYEYNDANRLANVTVNDEDESTSYAYNALGQRTLKLKADGSEERYHYNESGQLLSVTDGDGAILREYIYRETQQIALITRATGQAPVDPTPPTEPAPVLVLDESTVNFQGNHAVDNSLSGWTGTGFIDYIGEGRAEWSTNIPSEGTYSVRVRYALSSGNRRLKIIVNNIAGKTMSFPFTGSFSNWSVASETVVLPAGNITFALETTGSSGANIDKVELQKIEPLDLILLDEATVAFEGSHQIASNLGGYHNAGFIDVVGEGKVSWPLSVDADTTFNLNIRYSLLGPSRPMQILLDGDVIGDASFQSTGGFASWELFNVDVIVPAGNHIISLKTQGSSGPNIDQLELTPTSTSGGPVDPTPTGELALYYIHDDHLGTPQVVTNAQQQVVWVADYLPFGQVSPGTNNSIEIYSRFPGQYLDEETGLHYNYFRDYDPSIGRYIQSDPIGLQGGINTYLYSNGNPLLFFDFYGLCSCQTERGVGEVSQSISNAYSAHSGLGKGCVVIARDSYIDHFSDPLIGDGLWNELGGTRYDNLTAQMFSQGYVGENQVIAARNSRNNRLSVSQVQTFGGFGDAVGASGEGVYVVGVADGGHVMTLIYNESKFSFLDQGTGWNRTFTDAASVDLHMLSIMNWFAQRPPYRDFVADVQFRKLCNCVE